MSDNSTELQEYEASDLTPDHAVEIFRAWLHALPEYDWNRAEAYRFTGLTLYYDNPRTGYTTALHFTNANCGNKGSDGPVVAAAILHEAGFGDLQSLRARLESSNHCEFAR